MNSTVSSSGRGVAEMAGEWWRPVTWALLYTAQFDRLDEALIDRRARALLAEPLADLTPEDEYRAISAALASDAWLTERVPEPHGEQEFRDFLQRVRARMDAKRPWPTPLHRPLCESRWVEYNDARVVGRIGMDYVDAQDRIHYVFRTAQVGDQRIHVLVLLLRSGDEVALAAPWWPGSQDVAVLSRDHDRFSGAVVAALVDGSGFAPDEVVEPDESGAAREPHDEAL